MKKQDIRALAIVVGATAWAAAVYIGTNELTGVMKPLPVILSVVMLAAYVVARVSERAR